MNPELIVMLDLSRRADVKKRVKERMSAGICLCCEKKAVCRGLCSSCYNAFKYVMRSKGNKRDQKNFEAACIREGRVLECYDSIRTRASNVFTSIAKRLSS
jgi:hypothetical protein